MEQPISRATIINLEHLVVLPGEEPITPIARSIKRLFRQDGYYGTYELPPMAKLKIHFNCTHMNMYDALRILRGEGYDFSFDGLDQPLYVWHSPNK